VSKQGKIVIAYFGVNPSTADASIDDHTVKKWRGFSERNDAKRFIVGNVFAYRATNVKELSLVDDPIGPDNIAHIQSVIDEADVLVPCWGDRGKLKKHLHVHLDALMERLLTSNKPVMCFGKTKLNDPLHPLLVAYATSLMKY
jgi:hypothetical protein